MHGRKGWWLWGVVLFLAACRATPASQPAVSTSAPVAPSAVMATSVAKAMPTIVPTPSSAALAPPSPRRLQQGELIIAAEIDDIPAIFADDDLYVTADAGSEEWLDEDLVVGIVVDGDARAYPVRLLSLHEIVNDTIGGRPVAVTWCPLCFSAVAFARVVDGREVTFGVSGILYNNNLVMYDHQTNTLWSQLLGQAIRGALRGEQLAVLPLQMSGWGAWKAAYPQTRVLSAERIGRRAADVIDPYAGYYNSGAAGLSGSGEVDARLSPQALVVGLVTEGSARAYPLAAVRELGAVNTVLGEAPLLLAYDATLQSAVVYRRTLGERTLTFAADEPGRLRDAETGSVWDVRTGTAVAGPLAGEQLARVAAPLVYWFAWSDLHPETELFRP